MGIYEPFNQISSWAHAFRDDGSLNIGPSTIVQVDAGLDDKVMMHDVFLLINECQG
jgi:transcription factor TGA